MNHDPENPGAAELPRLGAALLGASLTAAERDEILGDLALEHQARRCARGRMAAGLWLWWQVLVSVPLLARRGWWRGWSGFESEAERMQPGRTMLESWAIDVRYALRRLRKRPTYAALAILTLSLGVAGTAAVYGVVEQLLVEPLPIRDDHEVVVFWFEGAWSEAELAYLRPSMDGFRNVAAYRTSPVTLRSGDAPAVLVNGLAASAELFAVLGRGPAIGPGFRPGDDRLGADPVVVISDALWRRLGARPSIVGERIELSGESRTVVGVMPRGFWFPDPTTDVWLAEQIDPANRSGNYGLIARLPPGTGIAAMGAHLERIATLLDAEYDFPEEWDLTKNPTLTPVRDHLLGSAKPALFALLGAMALILLIACVNVSALMLGQVESRGTELAVRRALGATGRRLLQQLVVESLVIGALSGLVGAGLATAGFRFLVGVLPLGALGDAASLDWTIFWAALTVAMIAATAVAVAPGAAVRGSDLQERLSRSRTGGVGGRGGRFEHGLVVGQVALVLLLTGGAALLIRSVDNLRGIDPGVDLEPVAVLDVQIPESVAVAEMPGVLQQLVSSVAALPGVEAVGATQRLPLRGSSDNWGIAVEGQPDVAVTTTAVRVVTPDYFRTMGIRVTAGRGLLDTDRDPDVDEGVVVVNRALAEKYFPGEDPLGRRIAYMERWDRIVGVVENVAENGLTPEAVPARYIIHEQVPFLLRGQAIVVRTEPGLDPAAILDTARRAIQAAAPGVAIRESSTMESVFRRAVGPSLQVMTLLAALAAMGLVLGAIGIYGVVSHYASRRKRDWAIQMALGLRPERVAGLLLLRGGALVLGGLAVGLAVFLAVARVLGAFLYGVSTTDPLTLAAAAAVLLAAGLLAASVPALRASRLNLAAVLREQ